MRQGKPDGADLHPAGRERIHDPSSDDEMCFCVVMAEGQAETVILDYRDAPQDERRRKNRRGRFIALFECGVRVVGGRSR